VPEVRYSAVADFSQLLAEVAAARAALKALRDDQNRTFGGGRQASGGTTAANTAAARAAHDANLAEVRLASARDKRLRDWEAGQARLAEVEARNAQNTILREHRIEETSERRIRNATLGEERIQAATARRLRDASLGEERISSAQNQRIASAARAEGVEESNRQRAILFEERLRGIRERNARARARAASTTVATADLDLFREARRAEEQALQATRGRATGSFMTRLTREFREGYRVFDEGETHFTRFQRGYENARRIVNQSFFGRLLHEFREGYRVFDGGEGRFTRLSRAYDNARRVMSQSFMGRVAAEFREGYRVFDDGESVFTRFRRGLSNVHREANTRVTRGDGGIVGSLIRDFKFGYRQIDDFEHRLTRLRRGIASVIHSGPSSGGGGAWNNFFSSFANAGNAAANTLTRLGKGMLSWRGLIVLLIAAIGPLVAMVDALGAVLLGLTNTVVSMGGAIAAVPGLLLTLASAFGAVVVAVLPLVNLFKLYQAQQKAMAGGTREIAQAHADAANKTRSAERAYRSAAKGMADALFQEHQSQVDLNEARRDALRGLQDLRAEVERSSLNEKSATLALARAQEDYKKALADPTASLLDREEALLRVQEAEYDLRDVQQRNKRNQEDLLVAERRGVEGSQGVVNARRAAAQATTAVTDASERLADATLDLAQAQKEQAAGGSAALKAQQAFQDALDKLSPSTKAFVLGLLDMKGGFKQLQNAVSERLFGPLVGQLGNLKGMLPTVSMLLEDAAGALGDVASRGIAMATSGPWKADFATLSKANTDQLTNLGDAGIAVADAFRNIAVAAIPFTTWLTAGIRNAAKAFQEWSEKSRATGSLAKFLETTRDRLQQVGRIFGDIFHTIAGLSAASKDFTDWWLDRLEVMTQAWADNADEQQKAGSALKTWLEDVKPLLSSMHHFIQRLAVFFEELGTGNAAMGEAQRILAALSDDVLPELQKLFESLSEHQALAGLFKAIGTGIAAINEFVEAGGGTSMKIFVAGLQAIADFWLFILGNPILGPLIAGLAVALTAFVTAAAVAKLTGLLKVWEILKWIVAAKFPTSLFAKIFGPMPTAAAATQAAGKAASTAATAQLEVLNLILAQLQLANTTLRSIAVILERCCAAMALGARGGAARTAAGAGGAAVAGPAAGRYATVATPGAVSAAEQAAVARNLRWASAAPVGAISAAELALVNRNLRLSRSVAAQGGGSVVTAAEQAAVARNLRLAGGVGAAGAVSASEMALVGRNLRLAGAAPAGTVSAVERALVAHNLRLAAGGTGAAGSAAAAAGAGSAVAGGAGLAARLGRLAGPAAIVGLISSLAADSGAFGGRGSAGKQAGQAGGAILSGVGLGAMIGSVVPGIGTGIGAAVGGVAGAGYSLYRDKGLRNRIADFGDDLVKLFSVTLPKELKKLPGQVTRALAAFYPMMLDFWTEKVPFILGKFYGIMYRFWTETVPQALGAFYTFMWSFWTETVPKALGAFYGFMFDFWTQTVPKALGAFYAFMWSFWSETVPKAVGAFYTYMWSFWTEKVPAALAAFYTTMWAFWTEKVPAAVAAFYTFMWKFWTETVPGAVSAFYTTMWKFWTSDVPDAVKRGLEIIWEHIKGIPGWFKKGFDEGTNTTRGLQSVPGRQSGDLISGPRDGLIRGTPDGRVDTQPIMATIGEFMVRKRVVDKPGAKNLLRDLNEERLDPAVLYAALDLAVRGNTTPSRVPARAMAGATQVVNTTSNSRGFHIGDVTINNPVRERAGKSIRSTLQTLVYLNDR